MVAALQPVPCLAAGPRGALPPRRSLSRGGEGREEGGKRRPIGVPPALACSREDAAAILVAAIAGPLLPADAANAGAADVLGRRYSPPLAIVPLLLWQLLLLLQVSVSASASAVVVVVIVTAATLQ